jgi:hypothetical protein
MPHFADESPQRGSMSFEHRELALLHGCAELLLTGGVTAVQEAFVELAPAFELDAFAAFVATGVDNALTLEAMSGLTETAISSTSIVAIGRSCSTRCPAARTRGLRCFAISVSRARLSAPWSSTVACSAPSFSLRDRRSVSPLPS